MHGMTDLLDLSGVILESVELSIPAEGCGRRQHGPLWVGILMSTTCFPWVPHKSHEGPGVSGLRLWPQVGLFDVAILVAE
jgi:hypothetical protein